MAHADTIGKAAEFDDAEEFLDEVVPHTKDNSLRTRVEEAIALAKKGKL